MFNCLRFIRAGEGRGGVNGVINNLFVLSFFLSAIMLLAVLSLLLFFYSIQQVFNCLLFVTQYIVVFQVIVNRIGDKKTSTSLSSSIVCKYAYICMCIYIMIGYFRLVRLFLSGILFQSD